MIPTISDIESVVLKYLEKKPTNTDKLIKYLEKYFSLNKDDLETLTACGRQKKFNNRVVYVRTKLIRNKKIEIDENKCISLIRTI